MNNVVKFDITKIKYDSFESAMDAAASQSSKIEEGKELLVLADNDGKYHIIPVEVKIVINETKV